MGGQPELGLTDNAAPALERGSVPECASVADPADAEHPGGQHQGQCSDQEAGPMRSGRPGGRSSRRRMSSRPYQARARRNPGRRTRNGYRGRRLAQRAPRPLQVGDAAQEMPMAIRASAMMST